MGEKLRKIGHEFGTTTGRPRRCGWLDLEMMKFAVELNGMSQIALTKLDVLDDFDEIWLCTGYTYNEQPVCYLDGNANYLDNVIPVYKKFKGWKTSLRHIRKYEDLPVATQKYIAAIEKVLKIPVSMVSVGPDRSETIIRK